LSFPEDLWKNVCPEAKDLVIRMTVRDQYKRISAKDCLEHKWFQNGSTSGNTPFPLLHSPEELDIVQVATKAKEQVLGVPETGSYSPKLFCKSVNEKIPDLSPLILSRSSGIEKKQNFVLLFRHYIATASFCKKNASKGFERRNKNSYRKNCQPFSGQWEQLQ
jgi:serine/threonine protein kinase